MSKRSNENSTRLRLWFKLYSIVKVRPIISFAVCPNETGKRPGTIGSAIEESEGDANTRRPWEWRIPECLNRPPLLYPRQYPEIRRSLKSSNRSPQLLSPILSFE